MRYHLIPDCARQICRAGIVPQVRRKASAHRGPLRSMAHRYRAYLRCMAWEGKAC